MKNNYTIKLTPYLLFIVYGLIISFGSKEGFPDIMRTNTKMPYLVDKPIGEDAYYMLTVSKNFAEGNGFTYNFNKETTGIQPLGTILYATIYKISTILSLSEWTNLRLIIVLNSFLLILFSITLFKVAATINPKTKYLYWTIPILTLFNFGLFRTFTYGLETGLYLLLFALTVYYSLKIDFKANRLIESLTLSILIGFTALARIDFTVIMIIFFFILLVTRKISIKSLIIIGAISSLITLPWFVYVYKISGSFIPSSGAAQSDLVTIQSLYPRFLAMLVALNENFTPWIYTGARNIIVLSALVSLVLLALIFRKSIIFTINYIKSTSCKSILYNWIISILILILIYTIFFWATHFYYRYSSPISIFIIVFLGIVISKDFETKNNLLFKSFGLFVIILFFVQAYASLHTGVIGNTHSVSAGFIKKNFSEVKKIGAFQSGVIGYFNSNVYNLDGKIDNNALMAIKNKRMHNYIEDQGIDVLVDWPSYIYNNIDSNYLKINWVSFPERITNNASICLVRRR